ncbi:RNA-directed DNA polymerase, eukaryota [Tanacetum coccineum]
MGQVVQRLWNRLRPVSLEGRLILVLGLRGGLLGANPIPHRLARGVQFGTRRAVWHEPEQFSSELNNISLWFDPDDYTNQKKLMEFDLLGGNLESWPKLLEALNPDDYNHKMSTVASFDFILFVDQAIHGEYGGLDSAHCATHVGCGSQVRFWKDVWIGDNALSQRYNRLFRVAVNEDCYVADRWYNNGWNWQWRRPIEGGRNGGKDGVFTVGETRKHIDNAILLAMDSSTRWNKFLPRKINVFMWRLSLDRLPHRFNLFRRGFDIVSILCPICLKTAETKDHVFSKCEVASDVWRLVRIWCDISNSNLSSIAAWLEWTDGLAGASVIKERLYVIITTTSWYIWKFRNSVIFNSHSMRKSDIFDLIQLYSFSWLKFRGAKMLSWQDWLQTPL